MGFFAILITALSFTAGSIKNELSIFLLGTVFLVILVYCFLAVFFLGILYRRKASALSLVISPGAVDTGKNGELYIKRKEGGPPEKNYFFRPPLILIRLELCLETKDGRVIRHYVDPGHENSSSFPVNERGAYFYSAGNNRIVICDAPGFFRAAFPLRGEPGVTLLALPSPAGEPVFISLKAGGSGEHREARYRKSGELADHRPYIPGDDPRRINWKLYGHAPFGELFVREEKPEPPPHSRFLILADTEADAALYSVDERRKAVDLLCETILRTALEYTDRGMDILVGYTGGGITGGNNDDTRPNAAELVSALARPFAIPLYGTTQGAGEKRRPAEAAASILPEAPGDMPVVIFALPRTLSDENSALEKFLKARENRQETDVIFLYAANGGRDARPEDAARICVNLYNGRRGVHARKEERR